MKRCSLLILLVLALALPASASAVTFGAEVGSVFSWQQHGWYTPAQAVQSLSQLYAAGGRIGRADSNWGATEPNAPVHGVHSFQWAYDDTLVIEMAEAHLQWEPTLQFAPKWAEAHRSAVIRVKSGRFVVPLPPGKPSNFAAYATAFMKRYGAHGAFWAANPLLPYLPVTTVEVWNEPDNTHNWGPKINLHDYMTMYEAVRTAVHRVNRGAKVVTGGLAWTRSSLPRLLKAFRGKPMDALGIHPYASTPNGTIALARYAVNTMRHAKRGRTPIILNEYGWTSITHTWGSTNPQNVNAYAYQALVGLAKVRGVSQILPFTWVDPSWGLINGPFAAAVSNVTHGRL
jgi:hypothetical protein